MFTTAAPTVIAERAQLRSAGGMHSEWLPAQSPYSPDRWREARYSKLRSLFDKEFTLYNDVKALHW